MADRINPPRFLALMEQQFPAVVADFDDIVRSSVYLQMVALARATQQAMSAEDKPAVKGYFAFVGDIFRLADAEVRNAVCVSYLECLSFDGRHGKRIGAREMLTPQLQVGLRGLEAYNAALSKRT